MPLMGRRMPAAALVGVVAALLLLPATGVSSAPPARADESECAHYADSPEESAGARQYAQPVAERIPPPLRTLEARWDCVTTDLGLDLGTTAGPLDYGYVAHLVQADYADLLTVLRAFVADGWFDGTTGIRVDETGDGTFRDVTLDDLETLDPHLVQAHFFLPGSGDVQIQFQRSGFPEDDPIWPDLSISVLLDRLFPAQGLDDPSILSGLRTVFEAAPTPAQWGVIAGGSVVLMLVVGWPSALLNSVVGSRYQSMVRSVTSRFRRKDADATPDTIKRSGLPGWLMWPGFALAAILGAFVDPDFGVNPMSARLVVTLFLSFLLFNLGAWAVVIRVARRLQPESRPYLRFRWGSLVLVALAVLVARLLQLEPGVIFGLVAGIAYATTLQAARSAIVTIVGSAIGLALAIVAWIGYSFLAPVQIDNFAYVFLVEFLAGVTVKGVSTLPLSLLPLGNLDGAKLFGWKKAVWGACYAVGLAGFMLVLLTIPKAWGEVPGDFVRWLLLFGGYAVVAIVVWAVNARMLTKKPLPPEKSQGDQPDAITID
jgi:hypothetical protein